MQRTEGTLEIVWQNYPDRNATPKYKVMFSFPRMRGGAQQGPEFTGVPALEAYLTELDIHPDSISEYLKQLKSKHSISIPNVILEPEQMRPFGY